MASRTLVAGLRAQARAEQTEAKTVRPAPIMQYFFVLAWMVSSYFIIGATIVLVTTNRREFSSVIWLFFFPLLPWIWQILEHVHLDETKTLLVGIVDLLKWLSVFLYGYWWSLYADFGRSFDIVAFVFGITATAFSVVQLSRHLEIHVWFLWTTMITAIYTTLSKFGGLQDAHTWMVLYLCSVLVFLHYYVLPSFGHKESIVARMCTEDGFANVVDAFFDGSWINQ